MSAVWPREFSNLDAIILGAGACGLMCAVQAGYLGKRVLLLEKNAKPGAKILISGGGRCNYTNMFSSHQNFISENEHFSKSAFAQWTVQDTISFFETYGIYGQEKTLGQLFPTTNNAKDIVKVFTDLCDDFGQQIICNAEVLQVKNNENGFELSVKDLSTEKTHTISAPKVIVATGGLPIPKMGATDFALRLARQFNLKLTQTAPALVPLTVTGKDHEWYEQLSGTSIFSRVSNEKISFEENILFTHWGLSGPAILQISSYWRPGEKLEIDLFPENSIIDLIEEERTQSGKKLLASFLEKFYSRKFVDALRKYLPIDKNLASLTKNDLENIEELIHRFTVKPAGDKGYDKAEVMRGGIDTNELSSKTLECKKIPGLFFGGECVDVTGWLGGYNFQWAWASGYVIAQNI
ncbi:aminoacetone oxidase family FAD-binding enzyme [Solitalea longa]|uniref:Aminoacetone oxidase family FAD-binding enzyme n=1 Tax=Solitalea longa TaxID=2079460 RepID=A0A2S5A1V3_9SPHI|nr:NAD(P)/FAD-dependent oxidoreductase [Solitalea longa]POY36242.1 aminoacetone oxidase family FAD-binding enzyme [Solitalea longa]